MVRHAMVALVVLLGASTALAAETAGRVVAVRGAVSVRSSSGAVSATAGMALNEGDQIRTSSSSSVRILLDESAVLDLGADTSLVLTKNRMESKRRSTGLKLWSGRLWARVTSWIGGERDFVVESSNAVAGVRGTELVVDVTPEGDTEVFVFSGAVDVSRLDGGDVKRVGPNERARASASGALEAGPASAEQQKGLRESTSAGGRLSASGAAGRMSAVGGQLGGQTSGAPGQPSPLPELDELTPPLELDPGARQTLLRGRIQVQP